MWFFKTTLAICFSWQLFASSTNDAAGQKLGFTERDRQFLGSLAIGQLDEPEGDFGNAFVKNKDAAELGKKLFYDQRLSSNGKVACSTCHNPDQYFTDGRALAEGVGKTTKNTPSILTAAFSPWQFWDGRRDSLWAQALGPLEDPHEHGATRKQIARIIATHYAEEYQKSFDSPITLKSINHNRIDIDMVFANVGKALMAYQHKLRLLPSKFDRFIVHLKNNKDQKALEVFNPKEIEGLKIFVGKGNCISCHNGPLLTNFEFHNVGVPELDKNSVDLGRYLGAKKLAEDEFSCLSRFSSTKKKDCLEMRFLKTEGQELVGAFKTPSLRNVAQTAPYMHSGQFKTLEEVVDHYNKPKPPFYDRNQHPNRPHFDILPLGLTDDEKNALVAFLHTLTSPKPKNDPWWPQSHTQSKDGLSPSLSSVSR